MATLDADKELIIDDRALDEVIYSPTCAYCKHSTKRPVCKAFPEGIPAAIWEGRNDHTKPFPGDHGIRFEPR